MPGELNTIIRGGYAWANIFPDDDPFGNGRPLVLEGPDPAAPYNQTSSLYLKPGDGPDPLTRFYSTGEAPTQSITQQRAVQAPNFSFTAGGPSSYLLELHDVGTSNPIYAAVLCPFVNSLEMSQPLAVQRTWTFGGTPYEEHSGFQQRSFVIKGRSGYTQLTLERFARFRNFMEQYSEDSRANKNAFERLKDIRLALNFLWEGESYWCTLMNFQYQRVTASSRVSYEYQLTLVTNGVAALRWNPDAGAPVNYASSLERFNYHGDSVRGDRKTPTLTNDIGVPGISDDSAALVEAFKNAQRASLFADVIPYTPLSGKSSGFANRGGALKHSPSNKNSLSGLRWLWQEAKKVQLQYGLNLGINLREKRVTLRGFVTAQYGQWLRASMGAETTLGRKGLSASAGSGRLTTVNGIVIWSDQFGQTPSSAVANVNELAPRPIPVQGQIVGSVVVSTGEDTAYDVAQRYLGDRNLWLQVLRLNNMIDARTKNDGSPLLPGDSLLVPIASGVPNIGEFYGTSFLIRDGDLVVDGDDKDVTYISGFDNFYQNLRHRLLTVRGENRSYRNFGLPQLIGTLDTSDVPAQALSNVKYQVLADHRVKTLTEITLKEEFGTLTIDFAVETAVSDKVKQAFEYPL